MGYFNHNQRQKREAAARPSSPQQTARIFTAVPDTSKLQESGHRDTQPDWSFARITIQHPDEAILQRKEVEQATFLKERTPRSSLPTIEKNIPAIQRASMRANDPGLLPTTPGKQTGQQKHEPIDWSFTNIAVTHDQLAPTSQHTTSATKMPGLSSQEHILQQKQAEPTSHKKNTTGLPDGLKNTVEQLSGLSLDNVQVHYHSARPAQVGALAYTQGEEIHVGPGQERYLGHEAWHVIQQKQGRVQPTLQTKNLALNNDAALEQEADVMGNRAMQTAQEKPLQTASTSIESAEQQEKPASLQLKSAHPVMQRAVGFEMQTSMAIRDTEGKPINYQTPIYVDRKGDKTPDPSEQTNEEQAGDKYYELSADSGPVPSNEKDATEKISVGDETMLTMETSVIEFVTPPYEQPEEISILGRRLDHMRQALRITTKDAQATTSIENVISIYEDLLQNDKLLSADKTNRAQGIKLKEALVGQGGGKWQANMGVVPQSTIGVTLGNLIVFVENLLQSKNTQLINPFWLEILPPVLDEIKTTFKTMPADAQGLVFLVKTYLLGGAQQAELFSYPKQAIPLMARTDFHSMFLTLSTEGKQAFQTQFLPTIPDAATTVFQIGFSVNDEADSTSKGPKIHSWVSSIVSPDQFPLDTYDMENVWREPRVVYQIMLLDHKDKSIPDLIDQQKFTNEEKDAAKKMHHILTGPESNLSEWMDEGAYTIDDILFALKEEKGPFNKLMTQAWNLATQTMEDLQHRDLMSRGTVGKSATSMGSMKVPQKGAEKDMAILENRMMAPWNEKQVDISWEKQLLQVFNDINHLLPFDTKNTSSDKRKRKTAESKSEETDEQTAKYPTLDSRKKLIQKGIQTLNGFEEVWQLRLSSEGKDPTTLPDYDQWKHAIESIPTGSETDMANAIKDILLRIKELYLGE